MYQMEVLQRVEHAGVGSRDPGRPRDIRELLPFCKFPPSILLLPLLLLLPFTMVMRVAFKTRLYFRCRTNPASTIASTTTTSTTTSTTTTSNSSSTRSGNVGGSRPHKPAFPRGFSRKLPLLVGLGLQSAIAVSSGDAGHDTAKRSTPGAVGLRAVAATTPRRHLDDSPDVAFDEESSSKTMGEAAAEQSSDAGKGDVRVEEDVMSPAESADALLADGQPRCFFVDNEVGAEAGESARQQRCLPTVFFLGVSKCGTTSLSDWLSHHPRVRWVRRPRHLYYLEAHVFDIPPNPDEWRRSVRLPSSSSSLRSRLPVEADAGDTVIDYTPHYSLVAEVPFRISDFYGDGLLRERGLKFLVVLREPAARTISSWMYKTDPKLASQVAQAGHPEGLLASLSGKAVEVRPLKQAVEEGMEMATRLFECVANATRTGEFGHGQEVTSCQTSVASIEGCVGVGGEAAEGDLSGEGGGGEKEGCETTSCETHVEPLCNPRDFLERNLYDAHVGKSMYALQLARWFAIFGRDNFHVMFTEDLALNPMGTLENALDFMGLDLVDAAGIEGLQHREDWASVVSNRSNEADPEKTAQLSSQVTAEVVANLRNFFAPHNAALEELLGVRLPSSWQMKR